MEGRISIHTWRAGSIDPHGGQDLDPHPYAYPPSASLGEKMVNKACGVACNCSCRHVTSDGTAGDVETRVCCCQCCGQWWQHTTLVHNRGSEAQPVKDNSCVCVPSEGLAPLQVSWQQIRPVRSAPLTQSWHDSSGSCDSSASGLTLSCLPVAST
jgi:hypothetical protein